MSIYQHHLFICTNQKSNDKKCCAQGNAAELLDYTKKRLKQLGIHGKNQIRANSSGCLGLCSNGPVLVIYPDNVWYHYASKKELDEIIEKHLINHQIVERLQISRSID